MEKDERSPEIKRLEESAFSAFHHISTNVVLAVAILFLLVAAARVGSPDFYPPALFGAVLLIVRGVWRLEYFGRLRD